VGSPLQAPLVALEIMLKRRPINPDDVREFLVRMNPGSVVDNREMPYVCIQHMLAVMLIDRSVTFNSAHDKPRMQDPSVLRQRMKVRLDPAAPPVVTITLVDDARLTENVTAVRGTNSNPMTREEVMAKARDLMTSVIGAASTARLVDATLAVENLKSIRELRPLLQHG
jgi:2-methylcitrate dehydratase PrpD